MFSQEEKDCLLNAVDSLKKYRRADIRDDSGKSLLDILYTDPLPNDQILKTALKSNTTFLIGRKGTGKSTIFAKLQSELRKKEQIISCYIDTNYVFESSKSDHVPLDYLKNYIPPAVLQKYLLERTFIQNVLKEIRQELDKRSYSIIDYLRSIFGGDKSEIVKEKIESLSNKINNNEILKSIEVPIFNDIKTINKIGNQVSTAENSSGTFGIKAQGNATGINVGVNFSAEEQLRQEQKEHGEIEKKFSEIFIKVFQVKEIILEIKEILKLLEIESLVILLDDFSEIDDDSMKVFVDAILAPLNNWSDEFIKFKIAAYPNRIYYGKIEPGKVDTIDLDFYNLYSEFDRGTMEERAIDFTKRLINKRIEYYTNKPADTYFDISKESLDSYYELIFQISMNVPRIIGYILFYCCESNIVFNTPISRAGLEAAAQKYYTKIVSRFFDSTTYSTLIFEEKISILQFKELLNNILINFQSIRKRITTGEVSGSAYDENKTNPHTSHFYFSPNYEKFLRTLELNFFISKYDEMSDRDGAKQSIYCLNYGCCVENKLRWGKPKGRKHRKYFIGRPFDFNKLIDSFLKTAKKIVCINPNCKKIFPFEQLPFLEFNNMKCPECHSPVSIISNAESIKSDLNKIDKGKLLPKLELSILHELNSADKPLHANEIAQELDCSYQLIGRKAKKLDENKKLIKRPKDESGKRTYILTEKAKSTYFV